MRTKLIFVHGAGEVSEVWHHQAKHFSGSDFLTLPGHPRGELCRSIEEYSDWLRSYIQKRKYNDVILVGHSAGNAIILTFVLRYSEQCKGLILIGAAAKFRPLDETIAVLKKAANGDDLDWRMSLVEKYRLVEPEISQILIKKRINLGPRIQLNDVLCCSNYDVRRELNKINLPTLIICGGDDKQTSTDYSYYLAANIENSQLLIIEGATHQVMLEKPSKVNKAIQEFATKVARVAY